MPHRKATGKDNTDLSLICAVPSIPSLSFTDIASPKILHKASLLLTVSLDAFQKKSPSGVRTALQDVELIGERLKRAREDYETRQRSPGGAGG